MRLRCVVRTDQLGLILLACILCLTEGKATISPHALRCADLLDRLLELLLPWSIVRNIIFLELLRDMV